MANAKFIVKIYHLDSPFIKTLSLLQPEIALSDQMEHSGCKKHAKLRKD